MSIGPFALLALALPVVLLGEWCTARSVWLRRLNVPASLVAGFAVALVVLMANRFAPGSIEVQGNTTHPYWLWIVQPTLGFPPAPATDVERPLLILFFTCIGLNARWTLVRTGGGLLIRFLVLTALIGGLQAGVGVGLARLLGESALFGLMTSNVSLMGGFGTAAGFAADFSRAGLVGAAEIGVASAALGVIAGGLIAGVIGGRLVREKVKSPPASQGPRASDSAPSGEDGLWSETKALAAQGWPVLVVIVTALVCMKAGAFLSLGLRLLGLTFPVYIGAMVVAAIITNLHDLFGGQVLQTERVDLLGSVSLRWLLAVVMIDLRLIELADAAWPLLTAVVVQVALLAALAYWVVFRVMGRDYEAAVMSAGMIGFGLGATSNALASMRVLTQRFGPAPRAFLIVPIVGAFLIDFCNGLLTTLAMNLLR